MYVHLFVSFSYLSIYQSISSYPCSSLCMYVCMYVCMRPVRIHRCIKASVLFHQRYLSRYRAYLLNEKKKFFNREEKVKETEVKVPI